MARKTLNPSLQAHILLNLMRGVLGQEAEAWRMTTAVSPFPQDVQLVTD